jgi:hypothetical protein
LHCRDLPLTDVPTYCVQSEQVTPNVPRTPSDIGLANIEDEERNGLEIASAALGQQGITGEVPFYTGKENDITRNERNNM